MTDLSCGIGASMATLQPLGASRLANRFAEASVLQGGFRMPDVRRTPKRPETIDQPMYGENSSFEHRGPLMGLNQTVCLQLEP